MPAHVAQIRQRICRRNDCAHQVDYVDPCGACPAGHWGPWVRCEGNDPARAEFPASNLPKPRRGGAGTELKRLLKKMGIRPELGCGCADRAALMDRQGVGWCQANLERIVGWLRQEAGRRAFPGAQPVATFLRGRKAPLASWLATRVASLRFPFADWAARLVVRQAIRAARHSLNQPMNPG